MKKFGQANIWRIDVNPIDGIKFLELKTNMSKSNDSLVNQCEQEITIFSRNKRVNRRNALGNIWNFKTYEQD